MLEGLGLEERFTADLVHPASGGSWRVEAKISEFKSGNLHYRTSKVHVSCTHSNLQLSTLFSSSTLGN